MNVLSSRLKAGCISAFKKDSFATSASSTAWYLAKRSASDLEFFIYAFFFCCFWSIISQFVISSAKTRQMKSGELRKEESPCGPRRLGLSIHQGSAVDVQNLAGDESCHVRGEKQYGFRHILRFSKAFERNRIDYGFSFFG